MINFVFVAPFQISSELRSTEEELSRVRNSLSDATATVIELTEKTRPSKSPIKGEESTKQDAEKHSIGEGESAVKAEPMEVETKSEEQKASEPVTATADKKPKVSTDCQASGDAVESVRYFLSSLYLVLVRPILEYVLQASSPLVRRDIILMERMQHPAILLM